LTKVRSSWEELRQTIQRLVRARGFTFAVVVTLAVGIGANSALFSVVESVLLSPLPYEDAHELVVVWETRDAQTSSDVTVSLGNFEAWRRLNTVFVEMAAIQRRPYNVTGSGDPLRVNAVQATGALLSLLGVQPALGRGFAGEEERPGSEPVCLIAHGLWLSRFGGDPEMDGARLNLDGQSHTVVGVLPPGFELPGLGISDMGAPQLITPLVLDSSDPNHWGNHNSVVLARLRDGVTVARADQEIASLARRLKEEYPEWNQGVGARVRSLHEQVVQGVRTSLLLLFAAVGFVLLLACVNVATLSLVRASERRREMAVRAALGAERRRIAREVLTEGLILSLAGGAMGMALCFYAVDGLRAMAGVWLPAELGVQIGLRAFAFTLGVSILAGIGFSLLPAGMLSGVSPIDALSGGGRLLGGRGQVRARRGLVATQVALALVLLVGTGLLLRGFARLTRVEPGYESQGRIALFISLPADRYGQREQVTTFLEQLTSEVRALPGVHSTGASIALPLEPLFWQKQLTLEDAPAERVADVPVVDLTIATPGFLESLGVPLIKGRRLEPGDRTASRFVALVNETFVKTHYGDAEPIGRRIRLAAPDHLLSDPQYEPPWYTIVGVVGDVRRRGLATAVLPEVYIPQTQDMDVAREFFVVVHGSGSRDALADALRRAVADVDPSQPVARVVNLDRLYSDSLSQPRTQLLLVGGFGLAALILAVMGVYGLTSQSVSARTREFGLRLALGARPSVIRGEVTREGAAVALTGIAVGLGGSLLVMRLLRGLLFGVAPTDPLVFGGVATMLICLVIVAAYLPAKRASRTDPAEVLRWE
jgi:putative ABC transport system permease protein